MAVMEVSSRGSPTLPSSSLTTWVTPLADTERRDLPEVIEDRHGNILTLITSQLPVENWHDHIGDPTIADAILDRLIHNAHRIQLKGESMKKTET